MIFSHVPLVPCGRVVVNWCSFWTKKTEVIFIEVHWKKLFGLWQLFIFWKLFGRDDKNVIFFDVSGKFGFSMTCKQNSIYHLTLKVNGNLAYILCTNNFRKVNKQTRLVLIQDLWRYGFYDHSRVCTCVQTLIFLQALLIKLYEKTFLSCEFRRHGPLSICDFEKMNKLSTLIYSELC